MARKDPAAAKAYFAKYRQEHREELKASKANYYQGHREERQTHAAQYYLEHRDERMAHDAQYRQAHTAERRALNAKRRALRLGTSVGKIDYGAIMERDKMICGICHKKVKPADLHFDHIIPLSKGGPHVEHNIQVAHAFCNMSKHASGRLPSQIRLAI